MRKLAIGFVLVSLLFLSSCSTVKPIAYGVLEDFQRQYELAKEPHSSPYVITTPMKGNETP